MMARTAVSSRASARRTSSASPVSRGALCGMCAGHMMIPPITGYWGWMRQTPAGSRNFSPSRPDALSRARRHRIEESGDAADPATAEHREIGALDRAVRAIGAQPPRKADVVAKAVGFADQLEFEIRKALLHARYQRVDAVMPIAGHQRIDVAGVGCPV